MEKEGNKCTILEIDEITPHRCVKGILKRIKKLPEVIKVDYDKGSRLLFITSLVESVDEVKLHKVLQELVVGPHTEKRELNG